ncbi:MULTISPECIES: hypothetical protein [Kocuria]|uniref:P-loop NTPase n=1 Tax=Kocuria gwangalliensis TaxID=501592 RepID=A0ABP8XE33_9MICC|nr:hypothetical protein [Kocuria sp.]MDO5366408.1 hypothetical protein [Kocuria sp.]
MSISVVTLGTGTWPLVDQIERQHGSVTVVRRCLDLSELLACAHTGMARVALLAEGAEELTASLLEQLSLSSVRVLVLAGHDEIRLAALGVTIVPEGVSGDDVTGLIEQVADSPDPVPSYRGHSHTDDHPRATTVPETHQADTSETHETTAASADPGPFPQGGTGRIITVWGPMGAPGRTVTALNVAAELALTGSTVLLVDADTYAASVAASLGMLEEAAGLAQACRLADQGRLDGDGLQRCATRVSVAGATMDVLTGLTRHDRWPEVRAAALETVLLHASEAYHAVVVDTSFGLESDEEISLDTVAPRRNAATLSACAMADTVIALGSADALGIPRLVKTLPDLTDAAPSARLLLVINKLRKTSVGRSGADSVAEAWARFSPGHGIDATLDWDPTACDEALLAGAVLAESAAKSGLRQQITNLAARALHPEGDSGAEESSPGRAPGTRLGQRMGAWLRR